MKAEFATVVIAPGGAEVTVRWTTAVLPGQPDYYLHAWAEAYPAIEVYHAYRHREEHPQRTRAKVFADVAATYEASL